MASTDERVCVTCGDTEGMTRLEKCTICDRHFCADCAHRAFGHRFCGGDCARAYWFHGEPDDNESAEYDD